MPLSIRYAEWDSQVQRQVRDFSRDYGPLRYLSDEEASPQLYGRSWRVGIPVGSFLEESWYMYRALQLAHEVRRLEVDPETDEREIGISQARLKNLLAAKVHLRRDWGRDKEGRFVPTFSWSDPTLLGAMWLQVDMRLAEGTSWRVCKGCGRVFNPDDRRQEFHDPACRNRYHVRRSRRKATSSEGG